MSGILQMSSSRVPESNTFIYTHQASEGVISIVQYQKITRSRPKRQISCLYLYLVFLLNELWITMHCCTYYTESIYNISISTIQDIVRTKGFSDYIDFIHSRNSVAIMYIVYKETGYTTSRQMLTGWSNLHVEQLSRLLCISIQQHLNLTL